MRNQFDCVDISTPSSLTSLVGFGSYSFSVIIVPRFLAFGDAANVTAWSKFNGPSALNAVAGLIAPAQTTGLLELTTNSMKKAVSSSESVPCVITTPATSSFASSALIMLAMCTRMDPLIEGLPTLLT